MPGIAVTKPFPGEWTLAEFKSLQDKKADYDAALASVQAKLGAAWTFNFDYASAELLTRGNNYRNEIGRYWISDFVGGFAKNDIGAGKCDADVVEALNDKVGGKKVVTFKMGAKDKTYTSNSRLNVTVSDADGVVLEWNAEWYAYAYEGTYVSDWILANC